MRRIAQAMIIILLLGVTVASAQKLPKADDVLKEAKAKAAASNKTIFLIFGASWCEACHALDSFLVQPDIAPIFEKYFVVAKVKFGEGAEGHPELDNPGSEILMIKYGGVSQKGGVALPFIAVLDPKAKMIANSNIPGSEKNKAGPASAGFATEPEEIKWFLAMVSKGALAVTEDERQKIQDALQNQPD